MTELSKEERTDICQRCYKEVLYFEMVTLKCECCDNFESDRICRNCLRDEEEYKEVTY